MTPAARAMPDHPYSPNAPWLGGINGCQFAAASAGCLSTNALAIAMKISTIVTLMITMAELKSADSLIPITRMRVITPMIRNATRLNTPVTCGKVDESAPWLSATPNGLDTAPEHWVSTGGRHGYTVSPLAGEECESRSPEGS